MPSPEVCSDHQEEREGETSSAGQAGGPASGEDPAGSPPAQHVHGDEQQQKRHHISVVVVRGVAAAQTAAEVEAA